VLLLLEVLRRGSRGWRRRHVIDNLRRLRLGGRCLVRLDAVIHILLQLAALKMRKLL
jgi:hypothetical protein